MNPKTLDLARISIMDFKPKESSKELWEQFHQLYEKLRIEILPKDKLNNRDIFEKRLILGEPDYHTTIWLVFKDKTLKELLGFCSFDWCREDSELYKENKEIGFVDIRIDCDYRRQGLGTNILKKITHKLKDKGCKYFEVTTYYPSGMNFCEKLEAKLTNIEAQNRLYFDTINWQLVDDWIEEGKKKNPEVKIEAFFGASEEQIEEYCKLMTELENEAPTLEEEDGKKFKEIYTPKRYREFVEHLKETSYTLYTFRTIESNGNISGMTEIFFSDENIPEQVNTGLTGVKSIYRGRGLGKWLKASMLHFIKENLPKTEYIVTGNADHNAPMLSINTRLGFKHYLQRRSYKFTIDKLINLLQEK